MTPSRKRYFVPVEGVNMPPFFSEGCFREALRFEPKEGDVFVVTYPRCGTTWTQYLVLNILRRAEPLEKPSDFVWASPYLEQQGDEGVEKMIKPGVFKTHLPLHKVPWSNDAKYIYVARHPKDCCVSYFHYMTDIPMFGFDSPLSEFVQKFAEGDLACGSYLDHLLPWYEKRNSPNVFFTTYEEMKRDFVGMATRMADFLNPGEGEFLRRNPEIMDKIKHNCSFEVMQADNAVFKAVMFNTDPDFVASLPKGWRHIKSQMDDLKSGGPAEQVRKGEVGSGRSELGKELDEVLEKWIRKKTMNSDVMSLWENAT